MKVKLNELITLPRLGSFFVKLVREAGVEYEPSARKFLISDNSDLPLVVFILSQVLGEGVALLRKCAICEGTVECEGCEYYEAGACDLLSISSCCICSECRTDDAYEKYVEAFDRSVPRAAY